MIPSWRSESATLLLRTLEGVRHGHREEIERTDYGRAQEGYRRDRWGIGGQRSHRVGSHSGRGRGQTCEESDGENRPGKSHNKGREEGKKVVPRIKGRQEQK